MTETTSKGAILSRGERLQIMLNTNELSAVDDFRFNNRVPSRAAAVRELLRRGLVAEGYAIAPGGSSRDFGVLGGQPGDDGERGGSANGGA